MERIWKLAVYIFWIVASTALILLAYVLSGNQYMSKLTNMDQAADKQIAALKAKIEELIVQA